MAHFAKVENGTVTSVIVADQSYIDKLDGDWIQTSYNTNANQHPEGRPLRGNYAGIGFTYDSENDVFYGPKPAPSCILNTATWTWEYPTPYPTDGGTYVWDETTTSWVSAQQGA